MDGGRDDSPDTLQAQGRHVFAASFFPLRLFFFPGPRDCLDIKRGDSPLLLVGYNGQPSALGHRLRGRKRRSLLAPLCIRFGGEEMEFCAVSRATLSQKVWQTNAVFL